MSFGVKLIHINFAEEFNRLLHFFCKIIFYHSSSILLPSLYRPFTSPFAYRVVSQLIYWSLHYNGLELNAYLYFIMIRVRRESYSLLKCHIFKCGFCWFDEMFTLDDMMMMMHNMMFLFQLFWQSKVWETREKGRMKVVRMWIHGHLLINIY